MVIDAVSNSIQINVGQLMKDKLSSITIQVILTASNS